MQSKLEIYALSVCFASVVCLVISLGIGSYSLIEINAPDLTMNSYNYDQYQSNEAYWLNMPLSCKDDCDKIVKPEEGELTRKRLEAFVVAKKSETRSGFQTLIQCTLFILFSAMALFIHWQIAKKCRESNDV